MDRRFDTRLQEMLAQAQVSPEVTKGLLSRLETFVQPGCDPKERSCGTTLSLFLR